MKKSIYLSGIAAVLIIAGALYFYTRKPAQEPRSNLILEQQVASGQMTFFVTSINPGKGADLDGLEGADNHCQALAGAAGAGNKEWRAYLSKIASNSSPAVNARDRIGKGPWVNFEGTIIANNLEELHNGNNLNKQTALTEKGSAVNGRGDTPNLHDILTGSDPLGRTIATSTDTTCGNWTSDNEGSAMVGHHDRQGLRDDAPSVSWNSSHLSRGCSLEALASSGGGGLFYCFAANK